MEAKRAHGHFYIDRAGTCQTDKLLDETNRLTTSGEKCTAAQTTNIRKGVELGGSPRIKGGEGEGEAKQLGHERSQRAARSSEKRREISDNRNGQHNQRT